MKDLQTVLTEYETTYGEHNLRAKGRDDGERGIPSVDTKELSPFESEIAHSAKLVASAVVSDYRARLEQIDAQIKGSLDKASRKLKDDEAKIQQSYEANKALHEQSYTLRAARDKYELAKKRFDVMFSKVGRMPITYIPHWLYVLMAFSIFIGEIPLNAMVFQVFGENQVMTWVMAFVIGLSIPLSAHFIGIKAREHDRAIHWANVFKALAVTSIIVIALRGLSIMRHDYLLSMKDALGLDDRLIETSYLFFWLNVAVFGAAIILSYLSHDPVPGYGELRNEMEVTQKEFAREEAKRAEGVKWVESAKGNELERARTEYREALEGVFTLKGDYDRVLIEGRESEARCQHQMMKDISVYRHENMRARKDPATPACFLIQLTNTLALDKLQEKLTNENESNA